LLMWYSLLEECITVSTTHHKGNASYREDMVRR
jgi:hypothetical protein